MTTLQKTIVTAALAALVGAGVYISKLRDQNKRFQQQFAQLQSENENLSNRLAAIPPPVSNSLPEEQLRELLRLRGEVGTLRQQNSNLKKAQVSARELQRQAAIQPNEQPAALEEDYPRTPDGATKGIFEAWSRGDWDSFFTNFGEPGVPRQAYDEVFAPYTNLLSGMEVLNIGEPTNSFGPNMWFVPYTVRFSDGHEKTFRLHVAQDAKTKHWFFKGGL